MSKQNDVALRYVSFPDASPNDPSVGALTRELERVELANRAFFEAYGELDHQKMMQCWLRSTHVRCVHPNWDTTVGIEDVSGTWEQIFEGLASAEIQLENVHVEVAGRLAWVNLTTYLTVESVEGQVAAASSVVTNIFELDQGGWRIVCHHASAVAEEVEEDLLDEGEPN